MRVRNRILAAIVPAAILVGQAGPAGAVPPVSDSGTQLNIVQDQGQACGFPVRWTINLSFDRTRFFDQDGNLTRIQVHIKEDNTIENLDTGLVLREGPDSFTQTTVFNDDGTVEIIATGLAANVFGEALKDVGRVVLVPTGGGQLELVFSAGPHPVREATTGPLVQALAAFCDVLS
jgi:hypothetical protein